MHKLISTILVAIDFTEKSRNAVEMAVHIAARHKANLILFHNITNHAIIDRTGRQVVGTETINDNYQKNRTSIKRIRDFSKRTISYIRNSVSYKK